MHRTMVGDSHLVPPSTRPARRHADRGAAFRTGSALPGSSGRFPRTRAPRHVRMLRRAVLSGFLDQFGDRGSRQSDQVEEGGQGGTMARVTCKSSPHATSAPVQMNESPLWGGTQKHNGPVATYPAFRSRRDQFVVSQTLGSVRPRQQTGQ